MEHTGVVKSFSPLKGWGFVTSEEAGGDLLLLKTELGGYCAQKGDQVSFTVRETPKGLQAAGVKVISTQDGTYSFFGVVKSYNENKGFGFLGCDAAMNIFGKDVFFMRSQVPQGLQTGAQVMFKARPVSDLEDFAEERFPMYVVPVETALLMQELMPHEALLKDGTLLEFDDDRGNAMLLCHRLERAARRLSNTEDTRVIEIRSAHQLAVAPVFNWVFQPVGEGEFTLEEDRRQLAPVLQSMVRKKLHFHLVRGNWHDYRLMLNLQRVQYRNLPINPIEDMIPGFESDLQDPAAFAAASFLHQNGFRSVDQRSPEGWTPICYAAVDGNPLLLSELLEMRADVNDQVWESEALFHFAPKTPLLHICAALSHHEALDVLIAAGAEVGAVDGYGATLGSCSGVYFKTALMWAAAVNNVQGIEVLSDAGAELTAVNMLGYSPKLMPTTTQQEIDLALHVAILHGGGSPEVILGLVQAEADINCQLSTPLLSPLGVLFACLSMRHRWKQSTLSYYAYHHYGATPLMCSVITSSFDAVAVLLAAGARVDVQNTRTALDLALETGVPDQMPGKAEQKERGPQAVGEVQAMGPMGAPQPMQGYAQMGGGGGYMGGAGGGYMGGAGGGYMGGGGGGYMGGAGGGYMSQLGAPMVPVTGMGGMGMSHPGMGAPPLPSPNQMLYGTIKQINQDLEKGWGHITCKALEKFLGKADIFVLPTSMAEVPGATAGAEVSFNVSAGNKGPHAINIKFCEISAAAGQTLGCMVSFSGTVSSFNPGKGWGFIESPQAKELFGTDIFFHQKAVVGDAVAAGDWVSFSIDVSGGRPSGANVEKVAGGDGGGGEKGAYGGGYGKAAVTSAVPDEASPSASERQIGWRLTASRKSGDRSQIFGDQQLALKGLSRISSSGFRTGCLI
eukprot:s20_g13.t1